MCKYAMYTFLQFKSNTIDINDGLIGVFSPLWKEDLVSFIIPRQ